MADLVGTRELARRLQVSPSAVTKAVKEGRIKPAASKGGRNLFDVDECRRTWILAPSKLSSPPPPPGEEDVPGAAASDNVRYAKARADKEEALAQQELMELETLRKTLLPRDELVMTFTQFLDVASQRLSGIPTKLLSRFPGMTPAGRDFLKDELRGILDGLGQWRPDR